MEIKTISENGLAFLAEEEGIMVKPYLDSVGIPTIGIGMTYYPDTGKKVTMKDLPLSLDRVKSLFRMMIKNYELGVYSVTRDDINQNQFDALVSLCYNIGVAGFKTSTVLKRVNANPLDKTIADAFMMWNKAGGRVNNGLVARRRREVGLYFTVCK